MLQRNAIIELEKWAISSPRKPLILRGARQVGKTTVVKQFSAQFDHYLYVNLEKPAYQKAFQNYTTIEQLVQQLFFINNKQYSKKDKTLLFLDEIQEVPDAINLLRYFYEDMSELHIIAAGSLLEIVLRNDINIPVGRVENLVLHPLSFEEFLKAIGEETVLQQFYQIPMPSFAFDKLMHYFQAYLIIGGMPEIVFAYSKHRDLLKLGKLFQNLLQGYQDDVHKYAKSNTQIQIIKTILSSSFEQAGQRITLVNFGNTNYNAKDVKEALLLLESARLLHLVYPITTTTRPIVWNYKKKPRRNPAYTF